MIVSELIDLLAKLDPNCRVLLPGPESDYDDINTVVASRVTKTVLQTGWGEYKLTKNGECAVIISQYDEV